MFKDGLPIVIDTGHAFSLRAKFKRCVPLDMNIKLIRVSPTLCVDLTSVTTSSPSGISPYLFLPPPVGRRHFGIAEF